MGYWQTKVLPKIKKVFEKNPKKVAAAEVCKTFDENKESYTKEFEEKKTELEAKVKEIYESSSTEIKTLIKERKAAALKKYSTLVEKLLEELSKIEFPGSKPLHEACSKCGPGLLPGPIFFVFEKVSTFVVVEEKKEEEAPPAPEPEPAAAAPEAETKPVEGETSTKEEICVEKEKKEEVVVEKVEPPPKVEEPTPAEPPKAC